MGVILWSQELLKHMNLNRLTQDGDECRNVSHFNAGFPHLFKKKTRRSINIRVDAILKMLIPVVRHSTSVTIE